MYTNERTNSQSNDEKGYGWLLRRYNRLFRGNLEYIVRHQNHCFHLLSFVLLRIGKEQQILPYRSYSVLCSGSERDV